MLESVREWLDSDSAQSVFSAAAALDLLAVEPASESLDMGEESQRV
jgi:hypothetical protein